MNWGLLRSYHGIIAVLIGAGACWFYASAGWPLEQSGAFPSTSLRYNSGFLALFVLCVVSAFVLRKYAHRGGYSPEFRMRVDYDAIERGNRALIGLQSKLGQPGMQSRKDVQKAANAALKAAGSYRVNRAIIEERDGGLSLRIGPREPLARMAIWMRSHLWYGTLFGPLVLLHGGFQIGSPIGRWLAILVALVWISGVVGFIAWAKGPAILTRNERDLSIEEAHSLHEALNSKIDLSLSEHDEATQSTLRKLWKGDRLQDDASWQNIPDREQTKAVDLRALLAQERLVHQDLKRMRRIRWCMMGWKLVHVPAAIALWIAVLIHVYTVYSFKA